MRMMLLKIPCSPSVFQNGLPLRCNRMSGLPSGMRYLPSLSVFRGGPICTDDSIGMYVFLSRVRKSKMLCLPGLHPVKNDAQATGVMAGAVVRSRV